VKVKMRRSTWLGLAQLVGLLCVVVGVIVLASIAWGLGAGLGCGVVLVGAILVAAAMLAEAGWI
jgi:hypothetical protein